MTTYKVAMRDPKNYLTAEQVARALDAELNPRNKLLFKMLWITGARVSEILNLQVSMVDLDNEMVTIRSLKKKAEEWVSVPIDKETVDMIKEYLATRGFKSDWLFTSNGSKPMTRQMAYFIIRGACERVGIMRVGDPRITKRGLHPHPHSLRHSFAMDWVKRGGRPEVLQRIMRHTDYKTTISYLRFTDRDIKDEFDRIKGKRHEA